VGISKRVEPTYPSEARRMRLQGKISVRVLINGNGEVEQACGDGHPLLRSAAENAALQWTFRTPKLNGENIPYIQETLVFDFVLDR
jgi:TonB family protein